MNSDLWRLLEEHFDAALALPSGQRAAYVERVTANDPALRAELLSLLRASESSSTFMEEPAALSSDEAAKTGSKDTIAAGSRIGPWRIVRLIGRGGMGEVYEVERADGQFEQRAALKLTRPEAAKLLDRFNAERQILARLDHPGIARLLDGGVSPDGRPYAVMEFVEGETLLAYCDSRNAGLRERLALFLQVCDAVAHAHRSLIVHRDIKPGNILVAADGRTRLLDFGIAKPLDAGVWPQDRDAAQTASLLTPDYAAPEQLSGEPITTATDVYALGVLLFELLVGRRPWINEGRPLSQVLDSLLEKPAPLASEVAAGKSRHLARQLQGDVDSIIAKCLRREPQHRYATVNALKLDIERSLRGDPILARGDARLYVLGRFFRRYRWATAAVVTIIAILGVGVATTAWQAERATREAERATATRDFLISVFRESDPRIARERAPGSITAKELLDGSVSRIEREFTNDPETQLALLEVASEIYGFWADEERFMDLLKKRTELARRHFGPTHPTVIESVLIDAWGSIYTQDYQEGLRILGEADALLRDGGHDRTALRAQWWLARAESLKGTGEKARLEALNSAIDLYSEVAPGEADYAVAVANSASVYFALENYAEARKRNELALKLFIGSKDRIDGDVWTTRANLARSMQHLGEFESADRIFEELDAEARKTATTGQGGYWLMAGDYGRMAHMRGERVRAHRIFAAMLEQIPADWKITTHDIVAREYYAERLSAEGRVAEAIPILETAERSYLERPAREFDLRRVRLTLGDAYDRVGRFEDARRMLKASLDERLKKDAPESAGLLGARERWARFLLDRGERASAEAELHEVLRVAGDRAIPAAALAHDDLARSALERGDATTSLAQSSAALKILDRITGLHDVRIAPRIWRTHAAALQLSGETRQAAEWNEKALSASRQYDDPSSPTVLVAASAR